MPSAKKADLRKDQDSSKTALNNPKTALEEETVACGAMFSALGALQERGQHVEAESVFFKEVDHKLMQKSPSAPYNTSHKKLDRLSATISILAFSVPRKISELCTDSGALDLSGHK